MSARTVKPSQRVAADQKASLEADWKNSPGNFTGSELTASDESSLEASCRQATSLESNWLSIESANWSDFTGDWLSTESIDCRVS